MLESSSNIEKALVLIKDICNVHSIQTLKSLSKNFSIDDRIPMTTSQSNVYKKKKTFLNGGLELLTNKFSNNKPEKNVSYDSLEVHYSKL